MSFLSSLVRLAVPAPGSKSAVFSKYPVVYTLPEASTAMPRPWSSFVPPMALAHTKLPEESSFCTKMSLSPALVRLAVPAPGSKSAVPLNRPVVYTLPEASTAMRAPSSSSVPPIPAAKPNSTSLAAAGKAVARPANASRQRIDRAPVR